MKLTKDKKMMYLLIGLLGIYLIGKTQGFWLAIPGYPGDLKIVVNAVDQTGSTLLGIAVTIYPGGYSRMTPATFDCQADIEYKVVIQTPTTPTSGGTYYFDHWENGWTIPYRFVTFVSGKATTTLTGTFSTTDPGPSQEPTILTLGLTTADFADHGNTAILTGTLVDEAEGKGLNNQQVKIFEMHTGETAWRLLTTTATFYGKRTIGFWTDPYSSAVDGFFQYETTPELPLRGETWVYQWRAAYDGSDSFQASQSDVLSKDWHNTLKWEARLTVNFKQTGSKAEDIVILAGYLTGNSSAGFVSLADKEIYVCREEASETDRSLLVYKILGPATTDSNGYYEITDILPTTVYYTKILNYHATFGAISVKNGPSWGTDDPAYVSVLTGVISLTVSNFQLGPWDWFYKFLDVIPWVIGGVIALKLLTFLRHKQQEGGQAD